MYTVMRETLALLVCSAVQSMGQPRLHNVQNYCITQLRWTLLLGAPATGPINTGQADPVFKGCKLYPRGWDRPHCQLHPGLEKRWAGFKTDIGRSAQRRLVPQPKAAATPRPPRENIKNVKM